FPAPRLSRRCTTACFAPVPSILAHVSETAFNDFPNGTLRSVRAKSVKATFKASGSAEAACARICLRRTSERSHGLAPTQRPPGCAARRYSDRPARDTVRHSPHGPIPGRFAMFALAAVVLAASALLAPPPDPMTIDVLSAAGTGCDANTSAVGMSIDNTAFTVVFSNFAVLGHGQEAKKDCTITLRVNHPDGFTFGIAQVDYRGFAHLESGAHGFQDSTYHFTGLPTRHSKQ